MAITYVGAGTGIGSYGSTGASSTFSFGSSVTANTDVLVLLTSTGPVNPGTTTVSDNLNGNWTQLCNVWNATNGTSLLAFFVQATTTGDPNITVACTNNPNAYFSFLQFTGFAHTATADSSAGGYSFSDTAVTPLSRATASNYNNEILLALLKVQQFYSPDPPTGWTQLESITYYYAIEATPTSVPFTTTFGTASTYDIQTFGIYDLQSIAATPLMVTRKNVLYFI